MHIMQLTDFYHPIIGGVQSYVAALSKELVRIGNSVVVVTIQPGDLPEEETIDGIRVIREPNSLLFGHVASLPPPCP
jgi:Glycosyltransferase Family 4